MAIETILLGVILLALVVVAVLAYVTTDRVLHDYYRQLPGYRPLHESLLYQDRQPARARTTGPR